MVQTKKDPVLAVLSLSGGNDGLNCVIPRNNGYYRDFRPTLAVPEDTPTEKELLETVIASPSLSTTVVPDGKLEMVTLDKLSVPSVSPRVAVILRVCSKLVAEL